MDSTQIRGHTLETKQTLRKRFSLWQRAQLERHKQAKQAAKSKPKPKAKVVAVDC
jgi:hypothetical protein